MNAIALAAVLLASSGQPATTARYEAKWESLDKRPVPQWWCDAKFGIFVHWGPYAVPAYAPRGSKSFGGAYSEWYCGRLLRHQKEFLDHHKEHYGTAPYANFAAQFTAEHFDPKGWADLFRRAGAKYVVLTSKHHDGYALWPSPESPYYNSTVLGSGRDLAGEFTTAMKDAGLKSGFYFSLMEYANPLYPRNSAKPKGVKPLAMRDWARQVNLPQMKELVENYKADIIWPDGEWDFPESEQLSEEFLAWLFNESSMRDEVVVNDRWGTGSRGRHGGHYTTEYGFDGGDQRGLSAVHPWEECRGIGYSFGYNRFETTEDYMSREKCVETLVQIVSGGGNLLLNVGPTADGRIPVIMQDRLLAMGRWLSVNGEAIYGTTCATKAKRPAKGSRVYLTQKGETLYAIVFGGKDEPLTLEGVPSVRGVTLVGSDRVVVWSQADGKLKIDAPVLPPAARPAEFALAYRIEFK